MVQRCSNGVAFVVLEPVPSVRTGIRVEIYEGANPNNLLDVLENSFGRKWTDPLRGPGTGQFSIPATDPKLTANPSLLAYGNLARFYLDGVARFAATIEKKRRVQVGDGDDAARIVTVSGRGALAKLEEANVYRSAGLTGDVERPFSTNAGDEMATLVDEAQARGALAGVTYDFTDTVDSNNAPYAVDVEHTERAGTNYLRVVERLAEVAVDAHMTPSLILRLFNERGIDRTIQTTDIGPVVLQPADNLADLESDEDGSIRNVLLIETPTGWLERVEGASVSAHRRREAFLSLGNVTSSDQVDRAADAVFRRSAEPAEQKTLSVLDKEGHRPYVDWGVGDWVLAPDAGDALARYRVRAITVDETPEGQPRFTPELSTITEELDERLERWLAAMARGTMGGTAGTLAEPVAAPVEVTAVVTEGVEDHVALHLHPDELADLTDVDVAGLEDGDLLRYDAGAGDWVPLDFKIDIDTDPPEDGQVLKFDAGSGLWAPQDDDVGAGGAAVAARIERHAALNAATSATAIAFDTEVRDDGGLWDAGTPTRLTAPADGWYVMGSNANLENNNGDFVFHYLRRNGTDYLVAAADHETANSHVKYSGVTTTAYLEAGDYIEAVHLSHIAFAFTVGAVLNLWMVKVA